MAKHDILREAEIKISGDLDLPYMAIEDFARCIWALQVLLPLKKEGDILETFVLEAVKHFRESKAINTDVMDALTLIMDSYQIPSKCKIINMKEMDFEARLLQETAMYYRVKSDSIMNYSLNGYLETSFKLVQMERSLEQSLFNGKVTFSRIAEQALIISRLEDITRRMVCCFKEEDWNSLHIFTKILNESSQEYLNPLAIEFQSYYERIIMDNVQKFMSHVSLKESFQELLQCIQELMRQAEEVFMGLNIFLEASSLAVKTAFRSAGSTFIKYFAESVNLMNTDQSAYYCPEVIEFCIRSMESPSIFFSSYWKLLSERILYDGYFDVLVEKRLLESLQNHCPGEYWSKFSKMFNDIESWNSTKILTSNAWYLPEIKQIEKRKLPKVFEDAVNIIEDNYSSHNPNRKLAWQHQFSRVVLNYTSPSGKSFELNISFPQCIALVVLEDSPTFCVSVLAKNLNMGRKDVYRQLKPLISTGILKWSCEISHFSDLTDFTEYCINENFDSGKTKIKFAPVTIKSDGDEGDTSGIESPTAMELSEKFEEQDKYVLQCLIVRTLKRNKALSAAHLDQVLRKDWNRPCSLSGKEIIDCIGQLIDKDYVEYDQSNCIYRYLP